MNKKDAGYIEKPFASEGDKADVPVTGADGAVNWANGYDEFYQLNPSDDPNAKRIARDSFNGLLYVLSLGLKAIQDNGLAPWIEGVSYKVGAVVSYEGVAYIANIAGTNPPTSRDWAKLVTVLWNVDGSLDQLSKELDKAKARIDALESKVGDLPNTISSIQKQLDDKLSLTANNQVVRGASIRFSSGLTIQGTCTMDDPLSYNNYRFTTGAYLETIGNVFGRVWNEFGTTSAVGALQIVRDEIEKS